MCVPFCSNLSPRYPRTCRRAGFDTNSALHEAIKQASQQLLHQFAEEDFSTLVEAELLEELDGAEKALVVGPPVEPVASASAVTPPKASPTSPPPLWTSERRRTVRRIGAGTSPGSSSDGTPEEVMNVVTELRDTVINIHRELRTEMTRACW